MTRIKYHHFWRFVWYRKPDDHLSIKFYGVNSIFFTSHDRPD